MPNKQKNTNKQKNNKNPYVPPTITVLTNLGRYIEIPANSVPSAIRRGIIDDYIHMEHQAVVSKEKNENSNIGKTISENTIVVSGSSMKAIKMLKEINGTTKCLNLIQNGNKSLL